MIELYRNYLATLQYHQEYGDKYGGTEELIKIYEEKLGMKEPYNWNYEIKVKTKTGEYVYEQETLEKIDLLLEKHKDYTEVKATKKLVKKRGKNNGSNK